MFGPSIYGIFRVRHPSFFQVFGTARSNDFHAIVFHDGLFFGATHELRLTLNYVDLMPFGHFLDQYRHSPALVVYIYAYTVFAPSFLSPGS